MLYKKTHKLFFFETISNPTLKLVDIPEIVNIVQTKNKNIKIIVDNTFATPYNCNPLLFGVNLVIHSATKFISGHNDTLCGVIVGCYADIMAIKQHGLKDIGANLSPINAYLVIRGLSTTVLRIEKATNNASKIANFLITHPLIKQVIYLGLSNHKQYQLAKKILNSSGTILAFEFNGTTEQLKKFFNNLKLIKLAVSLGSVQTLIEHPMTQTHKSYNDKDLKDAAIANNLRKLSPHVLK